MSNQTMPLLSEGACLTCETWPKPQAMDCPQWLLQGQKNKGESMEERIENLAALEDDIEQSRARTDQLIESIRELDKDLADQLMSEHKAAIELHDKDMAAALNHKRGMAEAVECFLMNRV